MEPLLSPRQLANAIGVSESSLKRWCDKGLLTIVKTAGGHRRISVPEALRFVREQNLSVVEPHLLAMTGSDDRKSRRTEGCVERLAESLVEGNEQACRAIVFDLFLAGQSVSQIFDEVIAAAFQQIGKKWDCHEVEIWQERGSCQIALRILHELRGKQLPPQTDLTAMGATIEGDNYSLAVTMAEIVLRSAGWDARLLGSSIPFDSMNNVLKSQQPRLFWLSVSFIADEGAFVSGFSRLADLATETNTTLVVGGCALTTEIRKQLRYSAFCDTMQHLEALALTLARQSKPGPKKFPNQKTRKISPQK